MFSQKPNSHSIYTRLAKALIWLCVCAWCSEPYLIVGNLMSLLILFRGEMSLRKSLDSIHVAVLLLVLIHANGIDSVRTLSQASRYRITQTNGKPSNLILKCAARVVDEDIGYKINTETGECSTGDSNNPEQGFTYFDKTDMLQRFVHDGVSFILSSWYKQRILII